MKKLAMMLLAASAMLGAWADDTSFDTAVELPVGGHVAVPGRLSATDRRNVFKLTNFNGAGAAKVSISGSSSTVVNAQFMIQKRDGTFENVGNTFTKAINENYTVWTWFYAADIGLSADDFTRMD